MTAKARPHRSPSMPARLAVVSTPIGNLDDLSRRAAEVLSSSQVILCEDTRHSGALLARIGIERNRLVSLNAHNEHERIPFVIDSLTRGEAVSLISDAGTPLVSDPGSRLVAAVIEAGFPIVPVPGSSAVLAALVVSGFDTSRFSFFGFLPRSGQARKKSLLAIADASVTSIVYESPRRVAATLSDLSSHTGPDRHVVVARELTKLFEDVWRGPIAEAIEHMKSTQPIGEYVLVIERQGQDQVVDAASVRDALARLASAGLSVRDAATAVEVLLDAPHRVVHAERVALGETTLDTNISRND